MGYQRFNYKDLEAIKIGKIGNKINTNCIVYRIKETIIDTGPPNQWKQVKTFIKEKELKTLLITHHHEDHSGNGYHIKKEFNPKILTSELSAQECKNGFVVELYRRFTWGKPKKFEPEIFSDFIETSDGLSFLPLKTPGHSEDMTCYLEKNRGWLFTGDLYISSRITHSREEENSKKDLESLKKVLTYDFDTVFCAHKGILENGRQALEKKVNYLSEIKERVIELKNKGYSLDETSKIIMGKEDLFTFMTIFYFSKKNFIKNFWE